MAFRSVRGATLGSFFGALAIALGASSALLGVCGPFTDVSDAAFCPFVLEVFTLGITTGTTPTTYDPTTSVSRLQMAAFLSRGVDGVLKRGSRRAALKQFAAPQVGDFLGGTTVGSSPFSVECDGLDVWVANGGDGSVSRVRASDGRLLETWTAAAGPGGILVALGRIFVVGNGSPGKLYAIDPGQPAGAVTVVANTLGTDPFPAAFDGSRIWTANTGGSVSLVTPGAAPPWTTQTVAVGSVLAGSLYDGSNIWIGDYLAGTLLKMSPAAAVLQTVTVGTHPGLPVFDGANIWLPNQSSNSVSVVRASNGNVLATLTGNGLSAPASAAFDGQRVLVTNQGGTNSVSLWKAADLTTIGSFSTGSGSIPKAAASDGVNFWVTLGGLNKLARF